MPHTIELFFSFFFNFSFFFFNPLGLALLRLFRSCVCFFVLIWFWWETIQNISTLSWSGSLLMLRFLADCVCVTYCLLMSLWSNPRNWMRNIFSLFQYFFMWTCGELLNHFFYSALFSINIASRRNISLLSLKLLCNEHLQI